MIHIQKLQQNITIAHVLKNISDRPKSTFWHSDFYKTLVTLAVVREKLKGVWQESGENKIK